MSELAPAFTHASELLTARDIATLLKITPKAVRLRMANVAPVMRDNLQTWAFGSLPIDYQEELIFVRKRAGAWTIAEAIQFATPKWEPKKPFAKLPAASQEKAYRVKDVLTAYYAVIEKDGTEREARCAARSKWLEVFFPKGCSERTIINWVAKIEARGGVDHARIEAYADEKSCVHLNQRKENRKKNPIPGELIMEFKRRCALAAMNMAAAHRSLAQDWKEGRDVPGLETNIDPAAPFPFTSTQLRKFAPRTSTRSLGNKGDASARRDALHHMTRTYAQLRPCEMYTFDDTRVNIAVLDSHGRRVEVKCYIAMELASRKIVGYVLREGHMRASDVDELVAHVLRHSGLAHERAGYLTTLLFERGTLACSPDRERFLRAMKPGQLVIKRTSMDGGRNFPGDYVQKASGHWMGKGTIESFMKTLGLWLRDIPGQIGSTYRETPAVIGDPNKPHAGGMVDESLKLAAAARVAAVLTSQGQQTSPSAPEATQALGVRPGLIYFYELRQRFARMIDAYNEEQGHRREGFDLVPVDKANGVRDHVAESSNQRWHKLIWRETQRGTPPEHLCAADTALLLEHRARPVMVTPLGVRLIVNGLPHLFWEPASEACAEADHVTGSKKKFTALVNEDDLSEIFILRADTGQFVECLPRYEKPGVNDPVALRTAYAESRTGHVRARHDLANIMHGQVLKSIERMDDEAEKMRAVVSTTVGSPDADGTVSYQLKKAIYAPPKPAPKSPSRHHKTSADLVAFGQTLQQPTAEDL